MIDDVLDEEGYCTCSRCKAQQDALIASWRAEAGRPKLSMLATLAIFGWAFALIGLVAWIAGVK